MSSLTIQEEIKVEEWEGYEPMNASVQEDAEEQPKDVEEQPQECPIVVTKAGPLRHEGLRKFQAILKKEVESGGEIITFNVVFVGASGSGKSTIHNCMTNQGEGPKITLKDGTTHNVFVRSMETYQNVQACITAYDTFGVSGVWSIDRLIFPNLIADLGKTSATINKVFIVLTANRFSVADTAVFDMLTAAVSDKFIDHVHIIVTHCPVYAKDTILKELSVKLKGFLPNLQERVTFVDLIDPRRFSGAAGEQVRQEWADARNELLKVVFQAPGDIHIKHIVRPFELQDLVRKYAVQTLCVIIAVLVAVLCVLVFYHGRAQGTAEGVAIGVEQAKHKVAGMFDFGWLNFSKTVADTLAKTIPAATKA